MIDLSARHLAWQEHAVCARLGSRVWEAMTEPEQVVTCMACPVRSECLERYLRMHNRGEIAGGVWAGYTPDELNKLRRKVSPR